MPTTRRPRKGSMGYSPRKRASSITARMSSWPEGGDGAKLQGFAGYKAGMTHAFIVDYRPRSTTAGQEIQVPVTILEVPPLKVCAVRFYQDTPYGRKAVGEVWSKTLDSHRVTRKIPFFGLVNLTTLRHRKQADDVVPVIQYGSRCPLIQFL